jgi:hypothetical protein|tara:strand:- start:54 stop:404 length:351 start_codon:yes stop_codon:yes gene_type:complete
MNYKFLLAGAFMFLIAQIITWFQLNSQFIWKWSRDNEWAMALIGIPLSFAYIYATKYTVEGFGGYFWPVRFVGFGIGIVVYTICVSHFYNESIGIKTIISLMLCLILICIQVFWKN